MVSTKTLRARARKAAAFRGHDMRPFIRGIYSRDIYSATCRTCGAGMVVNPAPTPNDIDISGRAVALNCPAEREN